MKHFSINLTADQSTQTLVAGVGLSSFTFVETCSLVTNIVKQRKVDTG